MIEESRRPVAGRNAVGVAPVYRFALAGVGSAEPAVRIASLEFDRRLGLEAGTVERLTGVRERPVATTETLVDIAVGAARAALRDAACDVADIDCLIFASAVAHQPIPTTAVLLKRALGFGALPAPAYDVNATCLGFLVALDTAAALLAAGRYRRILIVAAERPEGALDWRDPAVAGLFGSGAGAVVLEAGDASCTSGILALAIENYTEGADACAIRSGGTNSEPRGDLAAFLDGWRFEMDGPTAYRLAALYFPALVDRVFADAGMTMGDVDVVIAHQASAAALELMLRRLGIPREKQLNIFAEHGNQVSASIPTVLARAKSRGLVGDGKLALLLGTAAGVSLGAALWRT
jgi:3-oxoacyl-[acyl-carrier-protein] synthase-3